MTMPAVLDPARLRMPAALVRLTPRERKLLLLVGGALFLVINLFLARAVIRSVQSARAEAQAQQSAWEAARGMLAQEQLWATRGAWLRENQPALTQGRDRANVELLGEVDGLTKQMGLTLESPPVINPAEPPSGGTTPAQQSVSVTIDAKGTWEALVRFLHAAQQPRTFIVFENASIQADPADAKLLRARLRVARWYAPPGS